VNQKFICNFEIKIQIPKMKKVLLSDSGPRVSQSIYGFWRWSAADAQNQEKVNTIVKLCLELGINTFDLADIYGGGFIEKAFGQAISDLKLDRKDLVLFSKCGLRKSESGKNIIDNSPSYIRQNIEKSLTDLKTDYLDIFLLNYFDHLSDPEQTAMALSEAVNSGKVKHIGITNFTVFQHQLLASFLSKPIVTNHIEMNLMNISALQDGRLDYIKQQFSKPLAWSPLAGGEILEGREGKAAVLKAKLETIGKKYDANIEQTAVAWLMQLGTLPLIGSLSEERIRNAASAADIPMSKEDWYDLYDVALKG
jgi:predicted oxidoreductase